MNQFGKAAVEAVKIMKEENIREPEQAWKLAISKFTNSVSSINKQCPMNTFLGLFSANLIKDLPANGYNFHSKEKEYALEAVSLLKTNPEYADNKKKFWSLVSDTSYQSQLDVVLALTENHLLEK